MIINRHNYEEFFQLYADDELCAADKRAVEQFVQENTDLAEELQLFQQTRLPVEMLSFENKGSLYRFEAEDITAVNCEEQFLLYVDNELDAGSKEKVERFVLQHPAFQEQFTLLKQTKLPAEALVFHDKASLYRKEERPVVYMRWWKMAAAAAVIGLAISVWILLPQSRLPQQNIAATPVVTKPADQKSIVVNKTKQPVSVSSAADNNTNTIALVNTHNSNKISEQPAFTEKPTDGTRNEVAQVIPGEKKNEPIAPVTSEPTERIQSAERTMASANNASLSNAGMVTAANHSEEETASNTIIQPAVYKELDTDDEKKSLYVGSLEINKDKLRGFFRKATSLFRGKAKQEEDSKTESAPSPGTRSLK